MFTSVKPATREGVEIWEGGSCPTMLPYTMMTIKSLYAWIVLIHWIEGIILHCVPSLQSKISLSGNNQLETLKLLPKTVNKEQYIIPWRDVAKTCANYLAGCRNDDSYHICTSFVTPVPSKIRQILENGGRLSQSQRRSIPDGSCCARHGIVHRIS